MGRAGRAGREQGSPVQPAQEEGRAKEKHRPPAALEPGEVQECVCALSEEQAETGQPATGQEWKAVLFLELRLKIAVFFVSKKF